MSQERSSPVITFIVRVTPDPTGRLRGIVERVRTGAKQRFTGADRVGEVIERMLDHNGQGRRRSRPQEES